MIYSTKKQNLKTTTMTIKVTEEMRGEMQQVTLDDLMRTHNDEFFNDPPSVA